MTAQELQKLKKNLLEEKELIESELGNFAHKNPAVDGDYEANYHKPDQSDTSDEKAHSITEYEGERAVEQNLEMRLKEINETLKKVESGSYGICDKCLSPIEQKRLAVIPAARLCLNCAKKATLI